MDCGRTQRSASAGSALAQETRNEVDRVVAETIDNLAPAGEAVQPLFITVDPKRDTPDQLKD
jgi:hypothetical protein